MDQKRKDVDVALKKKVDLMEWAFGVEDGCTLNERAQSAKCPSLGSKIAITDVREGHPYNHII